MGRSSSLLFGGMLALFVASVSGQDSCVQVTSATYIPSVSDTSASEYIFQMEGRTTVTANTVRGFLCRVKHSSDMEYLPLDSGGTICTFK